MHAIDTNTLVRYLTAEQPDQASTARNFITAGNVFITITVLLECSLIPRSPLPLANPILNGVRWSKMTASVARVAITMLFSSLLFTSTAIAEEVTSIDRFQLWNNCRPVNLVVEHSLSEERSTIAVRSKLRAARLYNADARTWLHIREYGAGLTTGVTAQYSKELTDTISGESAWMITWSRIREGVLVGVGFTLESASQLTDEFIDEYLRVNAAACKNK